MDGVAHYTGHYGDAGRLGPLQSSLSERKTEEKGPVEGARERERPGRESSRVCCLETQEALEPGIRHSALSLPFRAFRFRAAARAVKNIESPGTGPKLRGLRRLVGYSPSSQGQTLYAMTQWLAVLLPTVSIILDGQN